MFDLKVINSVLSELEEERGIPREKIIEAIESALATAYNKEYGKRGRIVRATFNPATGDTEFFQVKTVVHPDEVVEEEEDAERDEEDERMRYKPEQHMYIEDAQRIKKDAEVGDEITFPLEEKEEYGRIAAQTAKQVIIQKIREAEKASVMDEFEERQGEIVHGVVQRIERGVVYVDLGRSAIGTIAYDEQIPGERFRQGERIRVFLSAVDESPRGIFLRLSRAHPDFLVKLFEMEVPELISGTVEIKAVAREPGTRSKVAVYSNDEHIDPVGSLVGQRGVRVQTVTSELGGERIDVVQYSDNPRELIEEALSPAKIMEIDINEDENTATVEVAEDQQSLAIGRGGQNVRLAAKLTGWKIDIHSIGGETVAETDGERVEISDEETPASEMDEIQEEHEEASSEDAPDEAPQEEEPDAATEEEPAEGEDTEKNKES